MYRMTNAVGGAVSEKYIPASEAAKVLGISRTLVHTMVNTGQLPYHMVGKRRKFLAHEILAAFPTRVGVNTE